VADFSEIFRRQLYGYSLESQLYKHSKVAMQNVWGELKALGLDLSFILETSGMEDTEERKVEGNGSRSVAQPAEEVHGRSLQKEGA
jgi:hypothetical protein